LNLTPGFATSTALLLGLFWTNSLMATEEPKFTLLLKEERFEIRRYAPQIIAEGIVDGDMDSASNRGFRLIADYIFGNNQKTAIAMTVPVVVEPEAVSEKIAMTAPVSVEPQTEQAGSMVGARRWRIHFVMPSQYSMATLPKPLNPLVSLREIPAKTFVAITYSGFNSEASAQEKTDELAAWIQARALESIGRPQLARYNPPWTLPFWRRNEILQEIKESAAEAQSGTPAAPGGR
jgi:hypothetical protein